MHMTLKNHNVIYAMGFTGKLFEVVASIGSGHERCNDCAQDACHVPSRTKYSERPTSNLAGNG